MASQPRQSSPPPLPSPPELHLLSVFSERMDCLKSHNPADMLRPPSSLCSSGPQTAQTRRSAQSLLGKSSAAHHCPSPRLCFPVLRAAAGTEAEQRGQREPSGKGHSPRTSPSPGSQDKPSVVTKGAQDKSQQLRHRDLCKKKQHQVTTVPSWLRLPSTLEKFCMHCSPKP